MPRFFVAADAIIGDCVRVTGSDAAHLARSLRIRRGETIVVVEDGRLEHGLTVTEVTGAAVTGRIDWTRAATGEPRLEVHVLQAIPARGMDDAVEALTAAGARWVHPIVTERSVARPAVGSSAPRLERWQAIARGAAQLSGRGGVPVVQPVRLLEAALAALPSACPILACVPAPDAIPLRATPTAGATSVALVIGPEGGLGPADLRALSDAKALLAHLGARVLPTRLAGAVATAMLLDAHHDLDLPPAPPPPQASR